jgi:3-hydroxyisobutyrate dehydrogenase-like beta-hydroxyacid dehydrogenase
MRIGFIGLGVQGLPLALNLLGAGHEVHGFDVANEPLAVLRDAGGIAAQSIGDIAEACEVVFICVAKDEQVIDVVAGENGLASRCTPGLIVVNHSTVSADTTARLLAAAASSGIRFMDAPVSGGARGAQERTMSFMVGGDEDVLEVCEPLFRISGPAILRTGPAGTATLAKLAHQVAVIGNILAMAEAVRLGVAGGLDVKLIKDVIAAGFARSHVADTWGEVKMAPHAIPIYDKDLQNSLQLADALGIELPGAQLMRQQLTNIVP